MTWMIVGASVASLLIVSAIAWMLIRAVAKARAWTDAEKWAETARTIAENEKLLEGRLAALDVMDPDSSPDPKSEAAGCAASSRADALGDLWARKAAENFEAPHLVRMTVSENDVIVLRCKRQLHSEGAQRLREVLRRAFPEQRVVVLDEGMEMSIIHKEEESDLTVAYMAGAHSRDDEVRGLEAENRALRGSLQKVEEEDAAPLSPPWAEGEGPTIVCLCGSTRFWREFQKESLEETLAGRIVLSIGAASGTDDEHFGGLPPEEYERIKKELDELHLRKIDMSHEAKILNVGGYIGESTGRELSYAQKKGKAVRFLEPFAPPAEGDGPDEETT